jgi:REP-associated tyrosine transposase
LVVAKGGLLGALRMPTGLKRITGFGHLHFITLCCYQRRALLGNVRARNAAVQILREVRARYGFALIGYVIMPEHVHLLISEVDAVKPATVLQVFKQRVSRRLRGKRRAPKGQMALTFSAQDDGLPRFWQRRYFDLNIYSAAKVPEKLHYMHANPVKAKLVEHPGDCRGAAGVTIIAAKDCWKWMRGEVASDAVPSARAAHPLQKNRKG